MEVHTEDVLFRNVRVFNGKSGTLSAPCSVLVHGNQIVKISAAEITPDRDTKTRTIEGSGRTLLPGLIDAHVHIMMNSIPLQTAMTADLGYINLVAANAAKKMLQRGFTTIRDLGGPSFGLRRAIDDGVVEGPRIFPSGAFISQTSGHGDFRMPYEVPRTIGDPLSHLEKIGVTAIADSPDEVRLRAREQLMLGATQIKLMAGGGVSSVYDPLDVAQYTEAEFHAAVEAAENWNTYVAVHAYTPRAIRASIAAGVKCIDHGQLADEPSAELMAKKGVWWSIQPFLDDEDAYKFPEGSISRKKQLEMFAGTDTAYKLAKKYQIKTAWGTDNLFDSALAERQGRQLAKMVRWYTPAEVLSMATAVNAELLEMCGPRNPYPGKLGVVEEGALADLLVVQGDPVANIELIQNPAENFVVIMKDGKLVKDLDRVSATPRRTKA